MLGVPGYREKRFTDYGSMPLALSVSEVAEVLAVGRNTAYSLVREGILPSVRVGRQIRVSRDAVCKYLECGA